MIFNIGYLVLVTALVLAVFGVLAGYFGGRDRNAKLTEVSFHAVYAVGGLVLLAAVILWYGLLTDKFQVVYVWNHSERNLPNVLQVLGIVGRASRQSALLVAVAVGLQRTRSGHEPPSALATHALRERRDVGHLALFPVAARLCSQSVSSWPALCRRTDRA